MAGLLIGIFMASMDNTMDHTIVATAMGTIVADLSGFDKFVWVTSAYMVTEMTGMPIFGKLILWKNPLYHFSFLYFRRTDSGSESR